MSSFVCKYCGMTNIDCGKEGYKTDREIELEEEIRGYRSALMAIEVHTAGLGGDEKEMAKSLLEIHNICKFIFDE